MPELAAQDLPLLADVLPGVTSHLIDILHGLGQPEPELAARLQRQSFHGRCRCRPGCEFALTAPRGSGGTFMLWLEVDGETIGEADLDPDGTRITAFTIVDHEGFADWLDATA